LEFLLFNLPNVVVPKVYPTKSSIRKNFLKDWTMKEPLDRWLNERLEREVKKSFDLIT
jgi:hypothetical protein